MLKRMPPDNVGRTDESPGDAGLNRKYPGTPYWPYSPAVGREDGVHPDPRRFVGVPVVVTEKLDGSNILLHDGKVYGRSVSTPSGQDH